MVNLRDIAGNAEEEEEEEETAIICTFSVCVAVPDHQLS